MNDIKVTLSDEELGMLDEQRNGLSRPAYLRQLLRKPPEVKDVASREESLAILSAMARDGKQQAAIALARELRGDRSEDGDPLEALLRAQ